MYRAVRAFGAVASAMLLCAISHTEAIAQTAYEPANVGDKAASSRDGDGSPLNLAVALNYDNNVTRASTAPEKFSDFSYSLELNKNVFVSIGEHTRWSLTGSAGAEAFRTYRGLNNLYAGGNAELQYRESGDFASPIWGVFGKFTALAYESDLRSGYRYSFGADVRQALTDRISLYGAVAGNGRVAHSAVFEGRDYSLKLNLDYALGSNRTMYLDSEYRNGDTVSSGAHTLANVDIAKIFVTDDAFSAADLYAYRFNGTTAILNIGYNHALDSRGAIDLSWRGIWSRANASPNLPGTGAPRYIVNQFSIAYLLAF
jgi:hypothetical protein